MHDYHILFFYTVELCIILILHCFKTKELNFQIIPDGIYAAEDTDDDSDAKKCNKHIIGNLGEGNKIEKTAGDGFHELFGKGIINGPLCRKSKTAAKNSKDKIRESEVKKFIEEELPAFVSRAELLGIDLKNYIK